MMTVLTDDPIDLDHLEKYIVGDIPLRDEILGLFSDQSTLLSNQFSTTQTDESWQNTAHALKGASRGIGAWRLGVLCEKAETLIGDDVDKTENRYQILTAIRQQLLVVASESDRLRNHAKCA